MGPAGTGASPGEHALGALAPAAMNSARRSCSQASNKPMCCSGPSGSRRVDIPRNVRLRGNLRQRVRRHMFAKAARWLRRCVWAWLEGCLGKTCGTCVSCHIAGPGMFPVGRKACPAKTGHRKITAFTGSWLFQFTYFPCSDNIASLWRRIKALYAAGYCKVCVKPLSTSAWR